MYSFDFEEMVGSINDIYVNLFIYAIDRQIDLYNAVNSFAEKTNKYIDSVSSGYTPQGIEGMIFLSALSKALGTSIHELMYMSEKDKRLSIERIMWRHFTNDDVKNNIIIDDLNYESGETLFSYLLCLDTYPDGDEAFYRLTFIRSTRESDYEYSLTVEMSGDGVNYGVDTDYMYDSAIIWKEEEGKLAEFIQETISKASAAKILSSQEEVETENGKADEEDTGESEATQENSVLVDDLKIRGNKIIYDELCVYLSRDMKSIELFDKYEGHKIDSPVYRRIVIRDTMYSWRLGLKDYVGVNLVIERCISRDYVGNITFTEFKQGNDGKLREFIAKELTDDIVDQYVDKDRFYRFSKPYRLRAQNSKNRTGYGWEWDWSDGVGDHVEGTFYGETTDYVFAGVYITSYNCSYYQDAREHYNPKGNRTKKEKDAIINDGNEFVAEGRFIMYTDPTEIKAKKMKLKKCYILVDDNGDEKYCKVMYEGVTGCIYIREDSYIKYKDQLKGRITLYNKIV